MSSRPDTQPYLQQLNPMTKLLAVVIIMALVSVTSAPALPLLLTVAAFVLTAAKGGLSPLRLLKSLRPFIAVSLSFMLFMLLFKGLEQKESEVQLLIFSYSFSGLQHILALGMRILCISFTTFAFVLTTDPYDLVLSLMLQLRVSHVHGYAALAAYRFLPAMQDEVKGIRLAQEIRGIEWNKGLKNRLLSPFRVMMPMLALAARKGERIALAMDSRGLGANRKRTFYKRTKFTARDIRFVTALILFCAAAVALLYALGLFEFGSALQAGAI